MRASVETVLNRLNFFLPVNSSELLTAFARSPLVPWASNRMPHDEIWKP